MSEAIHRMGPDEFLDWCQYQEERYELVDGVPVAMAGAQRRHDQIVVNAMLAIGPRLRGGPCRPFTADTGVRIPAGNIRRPYLGVDCGQFVDTALSADRLTLVIEVLSPSTRAFDLITKLDEYKSIETLGHVLLVDPEQPQVIHWSRPPNGQWRQDLASGLDAIVHLSAIDVALPLSELYADLTFRARPYLVRPEGIKRDRADRDGAPCESRDKTKC